MRLWKVCKDMNRKNAQSGCESCLYYVYDEEYEYFMCQMDLDEDEMAHFLQDRRYACPYYRFGDEYTIVRKQI